MPLPPILECCRQDLLEPVPDLAAKYPPAMAARVARIREIYNIWMVNPTVRSRHLRNTVMSRFGVSQSTAYADISVVQQLIPMFSEKSRAFHRARAEEMFLETYDKAKARNDTRTMGNTAAAYAKHFDISGKDEESADLYENVEWQPFIPSTDPTLLGIKPMPDVYNRIDKLTRELSADLPDIMDVDYEEVDLEEKFLFPEPAPAPALKPTPGTPDDDVVSDVVSPPDTTVI